jgi:hypothetical protein
MNYAPFRLFLFCFSSYFEVCGEIGQTLRRYIIDIWKKSCYFAPAILSKEGK